MTNTWKHTRRLVAASVTVALLGSTAYAVAGLTRFDRVAAHDTDSWTVWAGAGNNRVVVEGDGDTDLDCYVYDTNARLLGMDDDTTDYCVVDFHLARSGNILIRIKNLGSVYNQYSLRVE